MQYGEVPSEWKIANVTPIFKKVASSNPLSYRPISITCVCCKIFEAEIKIHLIGFFNKYNLMSSTQHGFL